MTAAITEIPSRLRNVSSNDPFVAGADDIDFNKPASTGTTGDYPYNGLGRIVLKKRYSENSDYANQPILEQADFDDDNNNHLTNTVFVIKYDFVLTEDIALGSGCVLEFDGGSISASGSNDTITGNNTGIIAELVKIFNTDVTLSGSWNVTEAYPEWFGAKGDGVSDDTDALYKIFKSFNTVSLDSNATYIIAPDTEKYGTTGNMLIDLDHNLYIKGNNATIKVKDNVVDNDGFNCIFYGNPLHPIDFICEQLNIDYNVNNNLTYLDPSTRPWDDTRFFYHGNAANKVIIRDCNFDENAVCVIMCRRVRDAIIDNCTFRYKSPTIHRDNSQVHVSPLYDGFAKVQNCKFVPYDYSESLTDWSTNMVTAIELYGAGAAEICNNEFKHVMCGLNVYDAFSTLNYWSEGTDEDSIKQIGIKNIHNNIIENVENFIQLWSYHHCTNNIVIDSNSMVRSKYIYGPSRLVVIAGTEDESSDIYNVYGGAGEISNIKICNNKIWYSVDWSDRPGNFNGMYASSVFYLGTRVLKNIDIINNEISNFPNNILSLGTNRGTVDFNLQINIINNNIIDNIGLSRPSMEATFLVCSTFDIEYYIDFSYGLNLVFSKNKVSYSKLGLPMQPFMFLGGHFAVPYGVDIRDDNDFEAPSYTIIKKIPWDQTRVLYPKYQLGRYNRDEKFRLAHTKDMIGADSYLEEYPTNDCFVDISVDTNVSVTALPDLAGGFAFDANNKNLQRGAYMTPGGNYLFVINSNNNGTLFQIIDFPNPESNITTIIKKAPVYI